MEEFVTENRRRGAAVGMFDGVHLGHRYLLGQLREECAMRGLRPSVFTFPSHPLSVVRPEAAPKLLSTPREKLMMLQSQGIAPGDVGFLVFDEKLRRLHAAEFLKMLHDKYGVDFILRGYDNRFGTERDLTGEDYGRIAREVGMELVEADDFRLEDGITVCSSAIRKLLASGDIRRANSLLGYEYETEGEVIPGKNIGHTIGFATANLRISPEKLLPGQGVYVCDALLPAGGKCRAMVNIGCCPTFGELDTPTVEAHLLDFEGNLYGMRIGLRFLGYLREEMRFDSVAQLIEQLRRDKEIATSFR